MKILTLDFETYYDAGYGLTNMTTEEYIRDERFEIIMVSVRDVDGEYHVLDGAMGSQLLYENLMAFGAGKYPVLCHNAHFDGAILAWRLGIVPTLYLDTMAMANATIRSETGSASLKAMGEYWNLPAKGDAVVAMKGRRRSSLTPEEFETYSDYCRRDTMICHNSFVLMEPDFPRAQLLVIDRVIRMFTQPKFEVDVEACDAAVQDAELKLSHALQTVGVELDEVMSDAKFAKLLSQHVTVPMKTSKSTGKPTTAFSKNDPQFRKLMTHPNPRVQLLMQARTMAKSTIERTRLASFSQIAGRNFGRLPVPLKYYGAITGRLAGSDNINLQNMKRGGPLRKVLRAPNGHYVVAADQAQIECRINAGWSRQLDMLDAFSRKEDLYSDFASELYAKKVSKETPTERFVGKTCILGLGYGMGPDRLYETLETQGVKMDMAFVERCVDTYRTRYFAIKENWKLGNDALRTMTGHGTMQWGPLRVGHEHIVLPTGLSIHYPNLRHDGTNFVYEERVRSNRVGSQGGWTKMYGAKLVENGCQAMAAAIIMEQLVRLSMRYPVVLQVHDEIVMIVPKEQLDECIAVTTSIMTRSPDWMPDLPLSVEVKYGETYGDCK